MINIQWWHSGRVLARTPVFPDYDQWPKITTTSIKICWWYTVTELVAKSVGPSCKMQCACNELVLWSEENKLNINTKKTKELIKDQLCNIQVPPVNIQGEDFERVTKFKMLGVIVNQSLKWNDHILSVQRKANSRIYFLKFWKEPDFKQTSWSCSPLFRSILPRLPVCSNRHELRAQWSTFYNLPQPCVPEDEPSSLWATELRRHWYKNLEWTTSGFAWPRHQSGCILQKTENSVIQ